MSNKDKNKSKGIIGKALDMLQGGNKEEVKPIDNTVEEKQVTSAENSIKTMGDAVKQTGEKTTHPKSVEAQAQRNKFRDKLMRRGQANNKG